MTTAANVSQVALAYDAVAEVLSLISCLMMPNMTKSMIIATSATRNAKNAISAAKMKPSRSEHSATRNARNERPKAQDESVSIYI